MSPQYTARERVLAARIVLKTLDTLPKTVAEKLCRQNDTTAVTLCRTTLIEQHLLPALSLDDRWRSSWDAAHALDTVIAVNRLPWVLHKFVGN